MRSPLISSDSRRARPRFAGIAFIVAATCWLAAVVVPPVLLARVRGQWLADLEHPERQAEWDAFRSDMRRQSGRDGPVQRKVPRSIEPPARVWLRDHFPLAVAAWTLFAGVLGGVFCLFAVGSLTRRTPPAFSLAEDESGRQDDGDEQHEGDGENAEKREHGRPTGFGGDGTTTGRDATTGKGGGDRPESTE